MAAILVQQRAIAATLYSVAQFTYCFPIIADKGIRDWIAKNVDQTTADEIRIQYGGSANAKNAPELSAFPDIDGFLVGGASLKPEIADIVAAISAAK